jgi:hypothetical protein
MERPMPLSPFDLAIAYINLVMMPLIIVMNYRSRETPLQAYLWRQHPTLVLTAFAFLSLLAVASGSQLLIHYGAIPIAFESSLSMVFGIALLVLSLAVTGMMSAAAVRYLRQRPAIRN